VSDKPGGQNPERPGYRLTFQGKSYGPKFPTHKVANEFAAWVEARTGLSWDFQSEDTLELLAQDFRRQR
jgi:hypothetical protein